MKAEEKYQIILSELKKKHLLEILYCVILMPLPLIIKNEIILSIPEENHFILIIAVFGLLHILASNILSFAYNLNWVIFPFAFKVSGKGLKILGALLIICASVIMLNH